MTSVDSGTAPTTSSITVEQIAGPEGPRTLLRLVGELDVALRDQVEHALDEVVARALPVVIDLAEVRLLGATGLTLLVRCQRACARMGVPCVMQHVTAHVRRLLVALELEDVLRHADSSQPVSS